MSASPLNPSVRSGAPSGLLRGQVRALGLSGDVEHDSARLAAAGLTDGLLVRPPTDDRVLAYLDGCEVHDVHVGIIPLATEPPSLWDLAACAVMAGCAPRAFPVVLAALAALTDPRFNLLGVQTTTSGVAPLLVVSSRRSRTGADTLDTLAVGRATRLALHALGNTVPGVTNLSTQGHPGKLSWCVEESPESPWEPLHVDRDAEAAEAVTAIGAVGSVEVVLGQSDLEHDVEVLAHACASVRSAGLPAGVARRQALVLLPPETARRLDVGHWDRRRLSGELARHGHDILRQARAGREPIADPSTALGSTTDPARPEDVLIAVSGGIGIKGRVVQTWGSGEATCAPVR